jgi:hypothetical protein
MYENIDLLRSLLPYTDVLPLTDYDLLSAYREARLGEFAVLFSLRMMFETVTCTFNETTTPKSLRDELMPKVFDLYKMLNDCKTTVWTNVPPAKNFLKAVMKSGQSATIGVELSRVLWFHLQARVGNDEAFTEVEYPMLAMKKATPAELTQLCLFDLVNESDILEAMGDYIAEVAKPAIGNAFLKKVWEKNFHEVYELGKSYLMDYDCAVGQVRAVMEQYTGHTSIEVLTVDLPFLEKDLELYSKYSSVLLAANSGMLPPHFAPEVINCFEQREESNG